MVIIQTYLWQKSHLNQMSCWKCLLSVVWRRHVDQDFNNTPLDDRPDLNHPMTHWIENDSSPNYSTNKKRDYSYDVADSPKLILEKTPKNIEILFPSKILHNRVNRTGRYLYNCRIKHLPNNASFWNYTDICF